MLFSGKKNIPDFHGISEGNPKIRSMSGCVLLTVPLKLAPLLCHLFAHTGGRVIAEHIIITLVYHRLPVN